MFQIIIPFPRVESNFVVRVIMRKLKPKISKNFNEHSHNLECTVGNFLLSTSACPAASEICNQTLPSDCHTDSTGKQGIKLVRFFN